MAANSIAGFPEDVSNAQANSWVYRSPELVALGNGIARMLNAPSMDDLPPGYREALHKILYAVMNSFGDNMGFLNMGNLFMNMQQAMFAGTRGGGGYTMLNSGNMLGATPGSGFQIMQRANTLTGLASQFYFNPDGTVNLENTQGMSPETFTAYAADVARFVPMTVQGSDRTISVDIAKGSGVEGIERAYKDLEKQGGRLSYTQNAIRERIKNYKGYKRDKNAWKKKLKEDLNDISKELDDLPIKEAEEGEDADIIRRIENIKRNLGKQAEGAKTIGDLRKIIEGTQELGAIKLANGQEVTYSREDIDNIEQLNAGKEIKLKDGSRIQWRQYKGEKGKVGAEGLESILAEALNDGADKNQRNIQELADTTRKARVYEDMLRKVEQERIEKDTTYVTITQREEEIRVKRKQIDELEKEEKRKDISKHDSEEIRNRRIKEEEQLQQQQKVLEDQRIQIGSEVNSRLLGTTLEAGEVQGVKVGETTLTQRDLYQSYQGYNKEVAPITILRQRGGQMRGEPKSRGGWKPEGTEPRRRSTGEIIRGELEEGIKGGMKVDSEEALKLASLALKADEYDKTYAQVEQQMREQQLGGAGPSIAEREKRIREQRAQLDDIQKTQGIRKRKEIEDKLYSEEKKIQEWKREVENRTIAHLKEREIGEGEVMGIKVERKKVTGQDIYDLRTAQAQADREYTKAVEGTPVAVEGTPVAASSLTEAEMMENKARGYELYKQTRENWRQSLKEEIDALKRETLDKGKGGNIQKRFNDIKKRIGQAAEYATTLDQLEEAIDKADTEEYVENDPDIGKQVKKINEQGGRVQAQTGISSPGLIKIESDPNKRGAQALIDMLQRGVKLGVDPTQVEAQRIADIARKAMAYEEARDTFETQLKERDKNYETIKNREETIRTIRQETFEQSEAGKKKYSNEEERAKAKDTWEEDRQRRIAGVEESIKTTNNALSKYINEHWVGQRLDATKNFAGTGVDLAATVITQADLPVMQALLRGGSMEALLASKQYSSDYMAGLSANIKNVEQLGEAFGTADYGEIKAIAKQLALGEIADPRNAMNVTERLEHAKMLSRVSGRTVESVLNEQGAIVEFFKQTFGSSENLSGEMITSVQNIGEAADVYRRNTGRGLTRAQAVASAQLAIAGLLDKQGSAYTMAKYALESNNIPLGDENRKTLQELVDKVENATSYEEQQSALYKLQDFTRGLGFQHYKYDNKQANAQFGYDNVRIRSGLIAADNILNNLSRLSDAAENNFVNPKDENDTSGVTFFRDIRGKNGTEARREAEATLRGILGPNGVSRAMLEATVEDITPERAEEMIQKDIREPMKSAGYSEEKIKEAETNFRNWLALGAPMREWMIGQIKNQTIGETIESNSGRASALKRQEEAVLNQYINPEEPEMASQGMVKDFIRGMMDGGGDTKWTNKDVIGKVVGDLVKESGNEDKMYADDGGLSKEGVSYLNSKADKSGTLFLSFTEKDGVKALENTDVLNQKITTAGGERIELWRAMGFDSLKDAKENAHGARLGRGMQQLELAQGQLLQGMGDGRTVAVRNRLLTMQDRADMVLESRKIQRQRDIEEVFQTKLGAKQVIFDNNGNIAKVIDKEGKTIENKEGKPDLDTYLQEANKDEDVHRVLNSNTNDTLEFDRKVSQLFGQDKAARLDVKNSINRKWEDLTEEQQKEWGNKTNYEFRKALVGNVEAAYTSLSKTEKSSLLTEINKLAQDDSKLKDITRKEGESDTDYYDRIKDKVPIDLIAKAMSSEGMNWSRGSEAYKKFQTVEDFFNGAYTVRSGDVTLTTYDPRDPNKRGKDQTFNIDEVRKGSGGKDPSLGGGNGMESIGYEIISLIQSLLGKLDSMMEGDGRVKVSTTDRNSG